MKYIGIASDSSGHRWSGWPGAYCFYCGSEDQREICLADCCFDLNLEDGICKIHIQKECQATDETKLIVDKDMDPEKFV